MIVVKIELVSAVSEDRSRELGRMYIANDGTSTDEKIADYVVGVCRKNSTAVPQPVAPNGPKPTRMAVVNGYPRLAYNVWRLVARAVTTAFPEEREVKSGAAPMLEPSVIRGLQWLAHHYTQSQELAPDLLTGDVSRAVEWLESALENPTTVGINLEDEMVTP